MTNYPIHNLTRPLRLARWGAIIMLVPVSSAVMAQTHTQLASDVGALKKVPFEELFNLEITTVSKRPERLVEAASGIQVITAEEIRRSGDGRIRWLPTPIYPSKSIGTGHSSGSPTPLPRF
jgi:hypothetical protein